MDGILQTLKSAWEKMSVPARIGGVFGIGAVFFGLLFLAFFSSPDYQPLFTDLSAEDAAAVVAVLQENGVPYRIADSGRTILVSPADVHETRMTVAGQGLPTGGIVGFEIFNQMRLGETEADRQLRFLWALQGELTRTIKELREVQDARVHIVLPRRSLFVQESQPSTASVLLGLAPGVVLTNQQVRGIAHLVSSSVEGLSPENVTIVDNRGNVLNDQSQLAGVDGQSFSERFEVERAYERQLESSVTAMLERIYGYGKVVARVSAVLDFDSQEEWAERFEAPTRDGGLVRSEQHFDESFAGLGTALSGPAGVDANVPGYVGLDGYGDSEYQRSESTLNYEMDRIERHSARAPGRVEALNVSVWLYGEMAPADLQAVEESVSRAVGLRADRGDQIFVSSMEFAPDYFPVVGDAPPEARVQPWWLWAIGLLLVVGLVALFRSRQRRPAESPNEELDLVVGDDEDEADTTDEQVSPEEQERQERRERVRGLAESNPQEFAQLMKAWLLED